MGRERVSLSHYTDELFSQVDAVPAANREQALEQVRNGSVIAAVVIPPDIAARIGSGVERGTVEVIYNGDALEQSLVESTLTAAIAHANQAFSEQLQQAASKAIDALLQGGEAGVLGAPPELLGLQAIPPLLRGIIARAPPGATRSQLQQIATFATFAAENLAVSKRVLATVGEPIQVHSTLLHGRRTPLDTYAVVVAVTVSLMFVCVLLAAGGLALEREERAIGRLVRGLVSRETLLTEKALLAAGCSFVVAFGLLAGVGAFVSLDWSRVGLWVLALAAGAIAFAALGVAVGALAREVRAASLLAFLLSLPLAFLALVPAGSVASGFYRRDRGDLVRVPVQGGAAGARRGGQRLGTPAGHLDRASGCVERRVRPAGPARAEAGRVSSPGRGRVAVAAPERSNLGRWAFHRRGCVACGPARGCGGSCARQTCAPGSSCCPCS